MKAIKAILRLVLGVPMLFVAWVIIYPVVWVFDADYPGDMPRLLTALVLGGSAAGNKEMRRQIDRDG
jgi:hypothetical protein